VKKNSYSHVMRITSNAAGLLDLKIAKKAGAKVCVARSSNSSDGGNIKMSLAHWIGKMLYMQYVDIKLAPSDLAAQYTFGKNSYSSGKVFLLNNGIDLNVYKYDKTMRKELRKEFSIPDDAFVVGHIGRFEVQKNHAFLVDVFAKILMKEKNSYLLLVGDGPLRNEIQKKVATLHIESQVIFAGIRPDIAALLSSMDVFLFPSLYEGMPNTVIEAQATGLPCVLANSITESSNITGLIKFLPLEETLNIWADITISQKGVVRKDTTRHLIEAEYDIQSVVRKFERIVFDKGNCDDEKSKD